MAVDFDQRGYPRPDGPQRQKVVNEHWPLRDSKGERHARGIPDQPNPIPVRARIVWEGDSEEWLNGMAKRWTRDAVFVSLDDVRLRTVGVWLHPSDVRRRDP